MTWQKTDTAPKDGTVIDLWIQAKDCTFRAERMRWGSDRRTGEIGWIQDGTDMILHRAFGNVGMTATHWMYMPDPPEEDSE